MMRKVSQKIIFIDRDGVINKDPIGDYIKRWKDFKFLPRALKALKKLSDANFRIVIISNQAGIGDGVFTKRALDHITKNMLGQLARNKIFVKDVFYCLHGKQAGCKCRKPEIGLFKKAAQKIKFNKRDTFFIGDKATDIEAGKRYKLKTVYVLTGHGRYDLKKLTKKLKPDLIAKDLSAAVDTILAF